MRKYEQCIENSVCEKWQWQKGCKLGCANTKSVCGTQKRICIEWKLCCCFDCAYFIVGDYFMTEKNDPSISYVSR